MLYLMIIKQLVILPLLWAILRISTYTYIEQNITLPNMAMYICTYNYIA